MDDCFGWLCCAAVCDSWKKSRADQDFKGKRNQTDKPGTQPWLQCRLNVLTLKSLIFSHGTSKNEAQCDLSKARDFPPSRFADNVQSNNCVITVAKQIFPEYFHFHLNDFCEGNYTRFRFIYLNTFISKKMKCRPSLVDTMVRNKTCSR